MLKVGLFSNILFYFHHIFISFFFRPELMVFDKLNTYHLKTQIFHYTLTIIRYIYIFQTRALRLINQRRITSRIAWGTTSPQQQCGPRPPTMPSPTQARPFTQSTGTYAPSSHRPRYPKHTCPKPPLGGRSSGAGRTVITFGRCPCIQGGTPSNMARGMTSRNDSASVACPRPVL